MTRITAVILTFNEAQRLRDCLTSVRWADEIVVVDGFSTDETVAVAREFTDRVLQSDILGPGNPGGFSAQRNFALEKVSCPWVLFLDADERCTPELAEEIRRVLSEPPPDAVAAYSICRREFFFGVHTPHTHGASCLVRLLRVGRARWDGRLVHEGVVTDGDIRSLEGRILHYSKDSISAYLATQNRYTSLEADQRAGSPLPCFPLFDSFRTFCNVYIYKGGYREGAFGLVMAVFFASYTFQIWAKCWETEMKAGRMRPDAPRFRMLELFAAVARKLWILVHPPLD